MAARHTATGVHFGGVGLQFWPLPPELGVACLSIQVLLLHDCTASVSVAPTNCSVKQWTEELKCYKARQRQMLRRAAAQPGILQAAVQEVCTCVLERSRQLPMSQSNVNMLWHVWNAIGAGGAEQPQGSARPLGWWPATFRRRRPRAAGSLG